MRGTHRPALGATPKDVVWKSGKAELWRYKGGDRRYGPPVVIVHSLVSRSYILDLRPGNSTVEYLTGAGLDVFMLDWGVPDELDADNDLERYVDWYLPRALAAARRVSGHEEVTLAGYCLGGVIAALYAAGHEDANVRNLILMATPVDYSEMGAMVGAAARGPAQPRRDDRRDRQRSRRRALQRLLHARPHGRGGSEGDAAREPLERRVRRGLPGDGDVVARPRAVPGSRLSSTGRAARPPEHPDDRLDPARGRQVDLANAQGNVLNAMAERDNVVPPPAVEPVMQLVGDPARREELRLPGGHVTFGTGRSAFKHTMPKLTGWIIDHSDTPS